MYLTKRFAVGNLQRRMPSHLFKATSLERLTRPNTTNLTYFPRRPKHTQENNPRNHTTEDVGKYFKVCDTVNKIKLQSLREEWELMNEKTLMVRQCTLDMITQLEKLKRDFEEGGKIYLPGWIIGGPTGSGKSTMAIYILDYALKNSWFPIFVPNARRWANAEETVETSCKDFLKTQLSVSGDLLNKISVSVGLQKKYKGPSLHNIIGSALKEEVPWIEATLDFIDAYRNNDQYPVMEIIDNYHALHALDEFEIKLSGGSSRRAFPREHSLAQNYLAFSGKALSNGVAMYFTSSSFMGRGLMRDGDVQYFFRLPIYSDVEFEGCFSHYHELKAIPSNNNHEKEILLKQTNAVPREVRQFCSFWNKYKNFETASEEYFSEARERFLERVKRIMQRKESIKEDIKWIGTASLGDNIERPPDSWIDAGFVFRRLGDIWDLLCPAFKSALFTYASNASVDIVSLFISNSATKGEGLELAFLYSFSKPTRFEISDFGTDAKPRDRVHRIEADHFEVLTKEDLKITETQWSITFRPNILYRLPPRFPVIDFLLVNDGQGSKQLQLFSFSVDKYDLTHQFSQLKESQSKEFSGNILQQLYKAAFGEIPTINNSKGQQTLPNLQFFFCTATIGPQPKVKARGKIPDSDNRNVCLVDGNQLHQIVDPKLENLIKELVRKKMKQEGVKSKTRKCKK